jgi:hypothetical protein
MSQAIKSAAVQIINDVHSDLVASLAECGEELDAESLADTVGDRLHDTSEEYRSMPYPERRALVVSICKQYV